MSKAVSFMKTHSLIPVFFCTHYFSCSCEQILGKKQVKGLFWVRVQQSIVYYGGGDIEVGALVVARESS